MLGSDGAPLYVGKAKNLKRRVSSYTQRARLPVRLQRMVAQIQNLEVTVTRTEAEALLLEASYIQRFLPPTSFCATIKAIPTSSSRKTTISRS